MGLRTGDWAHLLCPDGFDLPVLRSKDDLEKIQEYLGDGGTK